MDHLVPPLADDQPMFEAMVTTTWLAAHTERLRIGSLVLCDAFRHPGGARAPSGFDRPCLRWSLRARHRLGFGARRVRDVRYRVRPSRADRVDRLRETLEVMRALWAGEVVDYDGSYHQLARRPAGAAPARPHPDPHRRHRPEDARPRARVRRLVERARRPDPPDRGAATEGRRRAACRSSRRSRSIGRDRDREAVTALATRRFGWSRPLDRHGIRVGRRTTARSPSAASSGSTPGSATSRRRTRSPSSAKTSSRHSGGDPRSRTDQRRGRARVRAAAGAERRCR